MRISDWSSDVCSSDLSDIGACRTAALDNALPPPLLKELPPAAAGVCGRRKMGERSSDHCQRRPAEQDFRGGIPVPDPARHIEQDDTFGCQFGESGIVRRRSGGRYQRRIGTEPADRKSTSLNSSPKSAYRIT